jgi:hypothetical protein
MGQVWLANHRGLDIQVAVKFMRRDVADDPVSLARFEQEAKLSARIKSPHVVEVFDYDVTETGVPFIVMESLRGRDLETVLQNGRTLGISDTARVLVHVCKALSKAHAVGVIHRDIKAENVFVCQEDGVAFIKVLDFGVAKEVTAAGISLSGTTVGTPSYMSPEQLFHPKEIDLRTDLWATAVLVYRCLTGSFPFEGESFASVCLSVSKGKFAVPSARNSVLPGGLDVWFKRAFHKNLDARFSSAAEMSEAFLNELRKADLLPAWVDACEAPVAATQVSPRSSARSLRGRRSMLRSGVLQLGLAAATILFFQFAPPSTRAVVADVAVQATTLARTLGVNEGLFPPSLASDDEMWAPKSDGSASDVMWATPPLPTALAERELPLVAAAGQAGHVAMPRPHEITLYVAPPRTAQLDDDPLAAQVATSTLDPVTSPDVVAPAATANAAKSAPATPPADLATVRFGL